MNVKVLLPGMEKEKYKPTPEEVEKAEEMAVEGEMTPEQERMSRERSETFKAGRHKVLEMTLDEFQSEKDKIEIDKLIKEMDLSDATESFIRKNLREKSIFSYNPKTGFLGFMPNDENDNWNSYKKKILEIIEKAPKIEVFHECSTFGMADLVSGYHKDLKEIKEAVRRRFPNCYIGCRW